MKRGYRSAAGAVAVEAGVWLLATGFLMVAVLVTVVPFILL
jgi:hypothetical protein